MWEIIWYDVQWKIKTRLNDLTMNHLQQFNCMAEILSGAFGGGKDKNKSEPVKINDLPAEEAVARMNEVFRLAGSS